MNPRKFPRRRFLQVAGITALGLSGPTRFGRSLIQMPRELFFYIGTYTTGRSEGIYLCRIDLDTGAIALVNVCKGVSNPSFLAIDGERRFLYAVNEVDNFEGTKSGAVSSFRIDPGTSRLEFLNQRSSKGADPCHLIVDETNQYVLVANYSGGSGAVLPTRNGTLQESVSFTQHRGSSINPERQEGPHAHCVALDAANRYAFVTDLGLDQIKIYRFNPRTGSLVPNSQPFVSVKPGAGPRHFVFHPNQRWAYVINELDSTIIAFHYDAVQGRLKEFQNTPTLPVNFSGKSFCADIHISPSGKFLYGSNRGHDSLSVFTIDQEKGFLYPIQHMSTLGKFPRNFAIVPGGKLLLAANQNSDNIVSFWINEKDGTLTPTGRSVEVPSPVCIRFAG